MAKTNAVFGAEHSAHYYFRDFFGADSGLLAALHVIAELGSQDEPLSTLAREYQPYRQTGERNFRVEDVPAVVSAIEEAFSGEATIDTLDGLSVQGPIEGPDMWWFNVRASNTEPLLRVNIEAATEQTLQEIVARVDALIPGA
jgi:Phosphomannomutase